MKFINSISDGMENNYKTSLQIIRHLDLGSYKRYIIKSIANRL